MCFPLLTWVLSVSDNRTDADLTLPRVYFTAHIDDVVFQMMEQKLRSLYPRVFCTASLDVVFQMMEQKLWSLYPHVFCTACLDVVVFQMLKRMLFSLWSCVFCTVELGVSVVCEFLTD